MAAERELEILIIGAGFGGLAAAIELQSHGLRNITILERDSGIGGTWLQNSYPGAAFPDEAAAGFAPAAPFSRRLMSPSTPSLLMTRANDAL